MSTSKPTFGLYSFLNFGFIYFDFIGIKLFYYVVFRSEREFCNIFSTIFLNYKYIVLSVTSCPCFFLISTLPMGETSEILPSSGFPSVLSTTV